MAFNTLLYSETRQDSEDGKPDCNNKASPTKLAYYVNLHDVWKQDAICGSSDWFTCFFRF